MRVDNGKRAREEEVRSRQVGSVRGGRAYLSMQVKITCLALHGPRILGPKLVSAGAENEDVCRVDILRARNK